MKKSIMILIVIFPIVLLYASEEKIHFDGLRYVGTIEKTFEVEDGGKLTMKDIAGDVSVIGEARNNVVITEKYRVNAYSESSAEKILMSEKAKFVQKGNTIIVESRDKSRRYDSKFIVKTPNIFDVKIGASGSDLDVQSISGKVELKTSGGDIDIVDIKGEAVIKTSGGDVSATKCTGDVSLTTSGGDIDVHHIEGNLYTNTSGGDINVQYVNGNGELKTSGGDIDISNVTGEEFTARTSGGDIGVDEMKAKVSLYTAGGDIIVGDVQGDIKLHTSGGDIKIKKAGRYLDASTSGGDVYVKEVAGACKLQTSGGDIEIGEALDDVDANTSGGDIIISSAVGAIYTHTSGGNVEAKKILKKGIKDNSIEIGSSGGDILICIPDNMKADVDAEIKITDRWKDNEIRSDFPLKIERTKKGSKTFITGLGKINGGGDLIKLRTRNGNIKIRKIFEKK